MRLSASACRRWRRFPLTPTLRTVEAPGAAASLPSSLPTSAVMICLTLYGIGTLLWLRSLERVPGIAAYPRVGLGFALADVLRKLIFGDDLGLRRIVGILVVISGTVSVSQRQGCQRCRRASGSQD